METEVKMQSAQKMGFVPFYKEMDKEQTKMLINVIMTKEADVKINKIKNEKLPFVLQILEKRIASMKLPISFTGKAKLVALILSEGNPGAMVVILIDCLTKHEGKQVNDDDLCNLYPWGFYNEKSCSEYVNNWLKTRKCKWSEVYISKA